MNRRQFLKTMGLGGLGLVLAPLIGLPKHRDKPKTAEWMENLPPSKIPEPLVIKDDIVLGQYSDFTIEWKADEILNSVSIPDKTTDGDIIMYADGAKVSVNKMAKRLKEIECKIWDT